MCIRYLIWLKLNRDRSTVYQIRCRCAARLASETIFINTRSPLFNCHRCRQLIRVKTPIYKRHTFSRRVSGEFKRKASKHLSRDIVFESVANVARRTTKAPEYYNETRVSVSGGDKRNGITEFFSQLEITK